MPASMSSPMRSGLDDAGPSVQTIFARGISREVDHPFGLDENAVSRLLPRADAVAPQHDAGLRYDRMFDRARSTGPRRSGRPAHDHPHVRYSLAVVPVQQQPKQERTRQQPAPHEETQQRLRSDLVDGDAVPGQLVSLAVAR